MERGGGVCGSLKVLSRGLPLDVVRRRVAAGPLWRPGTWEPGKEDS